MNNQIKKNNDNFSIRSKYDFGVDLEKIGYGVNLLLQSIPYNSATFIQITKINNSNT